MTEKEWRACADPLELLVFLGRSRNERKLRLYLCNGCRAIWPLLYSRRSRESVETAERYADGRAGEQDLQAAHYLAEIPTFGTDFHQNEDTGEIEIEPGVARHLCDVGLLPEGAWLENPTTIDRSLSRRLRSAALIAESCSGLVNPEWEHPSEFIQPHLRDVGWPGREMVDCMFGNPLRSVTFSDRWLTSAVLDLARTMYLTRDFAAMPILADALEEGGCDKPDFLSHCRSDRGHVRGCWVIDRILGKE